MKRRRVFAAASSAVLAAGTCISATSPAAADPLPGTAHAAVGVTYPSPTTFHVCAAGSDITGGTGEWLFEVDGLRGDGTQIHYEETTFGSGFSDCVYPDISTNGTQDGDFVATLFFAHEPPIDKSGTQTSSTPEFLALASEETDWTPQQNGAGFGT